MPATASPWNAAYTQLEFLPDLWAIAAQHFGDIPALIDPHVEPAVTLTYRQLYDQFQTFAAGLQALGVQVGDHLSLFADNSSRWLIADQGSMMAGVVNVVRSSQADAEELAYILAHSESTTLLLEDHKTLKTLAPYLKEHNLQLIGLLEDVAPPEALRESVSMPVYTFAEILAAGQGQPRQEPNRDRQQLATLMYTSGTSGQPKGVMLTHANLLHQMTTFSTILQPQPEDRALSILPTWHCFGRIVDYFLLSQGCTSVYTNIRHLKKDLEVYRPNYMASVPRLWESLYEGIQKLFRNQSPGQRRLVQFFFAASERYVICKRTASGLNLNRLKASPPLRLGAGLLQGMLWPLHALGDRLVYRKVRQAMGGQFRLSISGGGALAMHLENFFEIVGLQLLVGYGLTETSPVLTARTPRRNLRRSAGQPIPQTQLKIVDPETALPLRQGQKGLVLARGPQVMKGYYNNPEATAKAIDPEGWFDTGDIGWLTRQQDLILTGRAKDTIVLSNGENIEPEPIENACVRSPYLDQIMVVGQDQRSLGALIVPNLEALQQWAIAQNASLDVPVALQAKLPVAPTDATPLSLESEAVQGLIRKELVREIQNRPGYRPDDRIGPFVCLLEPFSQENGLLTQTFKLRRAIVTDRYRDMIDGMF
jgi:long-chain acyl-CoA synthetase